MRVEEEREPLAEGVGREPGGHRRLAVGDAVGEREGDLLHRRRSRLADVVPGDRDRVPGRDALRAVGEQVGGEPHRGPRREDVVAPGRVLLEHVVLHRAAQAVARDTLPLRDELVEQQQQRGRGVDRHRGGDLVERDPVEERLHVGDRVDRHAGTPDLAVRTRVVRVVPELRGEVERDREARLALREQVPEAGVRLLGRAEPCVLADRPRAAAVHVRVRAARERERAGRLRLRSPGASAARYTGLHLDPRLEHASVRGRRHGSIVR